MFEDKNTQEAEEGRIRKKPNRVVSFGGTPMPKKAISSFKTKQSFQNKSLHISTFLSPQHNNSKVDKVTEGGSEPKVNRLFSPKQSNHEANALIYNQTSKNPIKVLSKPMVDLPALAPMRNGKNVPNQFMHTIDYGERQPKIPRIEQSKISAKKIGVIKAYAANTHKGIIRYK